jgi:hypothetical protein
VGSRSIFVLVDYTLFHHKEDVFGEANILERISGNSDKISYAHAALSVYGEMRVDGRLYLEQRKSQGKAGELS